MKIENTFTVDAPIAEAWTLLTDIPQIAPCLPGAKLTGEEDGVYSGGVKVKVGPITAEYKGTASFVEFDEVARKAVINGKGRDTRGAGNAQALITAQMTDVGGTQTQVDIVTDLKVSGKVAQFGRGVMQDISEKLLGQFAECLEQKIGDDETIDGIAAASAEAAEVSGSAASEAAADVSSDATAMVDDAADGAAETAEGASNKVAGAAAGAAAVAGGAAAAASGAMSGATDSAKDVAGSIADKAKGAMSTSDTADDSDDANSDDDDALDLLDVAGGAVFKRFIPVAGVAVVIIAIIVWLASR